MSRHAPGWYLLLFAPLLLAQTPSTLTIRVVEGDGAINSIRLHRAHDPVVQVLDPTGRAVRNATVTFLLPGTGPSGEFESGLSSTMQTGADGMAAAHGLKPNRVAGQFRIRVTASAGGQAASAAIVQTNAEPVVKSGNSKMIAILALIGGAAAAGVVAGTRGGKSSAAAVETGASAGSVTPGSIIPGTPSLGPPH
jgi:hypothetical protein